MAKHEEVSTELRNEIATGKYGDDGRLPSEAQLVERFGVSRPTVSRALRDLQMEGLIERRAGSGSFVKQRQQEKKFSRVFGMLVPERGATEIFTVICGELNALARVHNTGILWGDSPIPCADRDASTEHAREVCMRFVEKSVVGVFFAPFEHAAEKTSVNRELVEILGQAGIPVVLLDRDVTPYPRRSEHDLIGLDNINAGFILAEHLIRLGCRKLRFILRPGSAPTVDARIIGTQGAMIRHGINVDSSLVAEGDPSDQAFVKSLRAGKECDGIICANDFTAAELLKSFESLKINVPEKVRVAGFDDVHHATLMSVALTTIHQPCKEIADVAFRAMLERIHEPLIPSRTISLPPRLVVRESCGAYFSK